MSSRDRTGTPIKVVGSHRRPPGTAPASTPPARVSVAPATPDVPLTHRLQRLQGPMDQLKTELAQLMEALQKPAEP
jgi:hypothetical protein